MEEIKRKGVCIKKRDIFLGFYLFFVCFILIMVEQKGGKRKFGGSFLLVVMRDET